MLTLPAGVRDKYQKTILANGYEIVIRSLLEGGSCIAFSCQIESLLTYPHEFMSVTFPKRIETCELRKHTRVATCISGEIQNTGVDKIPTIRGCVLDISLGGCCFTFDVPKYINKVNYKNLKLNLGGQTQPASIFTGEIKNQQQHLNKMRLGIKFGDKRQNTSELLQRLYIDLTALQPA